MSNGHKQLILNIPSKIYDELDKVTHHKIKDYFNELIQKITYHPKKTNISKIFGLYSSRDPFSVDHDKHLYK